MEKDIVCPKCGSRSTIPEFASFTDIYDPKAIYDDPRAGIKRFTGCYKCLDCGYIFEKGE